MLGCYTAESGKIRYIGNNVSEQIANVRDVSFAPRKAAELVRGFKNNPQYLHLHNIDNAVHQAATSYFYGMGAEWCNLPLTTKMISSPGEVYAGKQLDYTSDALPVSLEWFDEGSIFLAESSQFYLEMRLLIPEVQRVFSIYNSFRKEKADFSHLAEFQHIEFEGKVSFEENIEVMIGLLRALTDHIVKNNASDLAYYLSDEDVSDLSQSFDDKNIERLTFTEAMKILRESLGDSKYKKVTLAHFGSYEEVALTRIVGKHCLVSEYPLEEIPFYHDASFTDVSGKKFAKNADFILLGGREVIGSGQRITSLDAIREKAKFFNLPVEDYEPYIKMREIEGFQATCGFGLGWQRYTQWLLQLPFIWDATHIPRGHHSPRP